MKFDPSSRDDIQDAMLLKNGEYDFEVVESEEKVSKSGNDMISLRLTIFGPGGKEFWLRDWLVASGEPLCKMKIVTFCEATGIMDAYNAGEVDAFTCRGLTGRVLIGTRRQANYGPQNCVMDYIRPSAAPEPPLGVPASQTKRANEAADDGDVPF